MFLQAAGMATGTVRAIAEGREGEMLSGRQRALVAFSDKITRAPRAFTAADADQLRGTLGSESDFLEAANVTAGFNFANRCADALGVQPEIPAVVRHPAVRWLVMRVLSRAIRARMNLENRVPTSASADEVIRRLRAELEQRGLGRLPAFFERLRPRPDLVAVQAAATRAVVLENELPLETNLSVAYLISTINGDGNWAEASWRELDRAGVSLAPLDEIAAGGAGDGALSPRERKIFLFARDVTLNADRITDEQVRSLRRLGLSDPIIVDLVAVCAAVNSGNRLNVMLAPDAARTVSPSAPVLSVSR
jgi:alkylhydroperoxidase family enzyme